MALTVQHGTESTNLITHPHPPTPERARHTPGVLTYNVLLICSLSVRVSVFSKIYGWCKHYPLHSVADSTRENTNCSLYSLTSTVIVAVVIIVVVVI